MIDNITADPKILDGKPIVQASSFRSLTGKSNLYERRNNDSGRV